MEKFGPRIQADWNPDFLPLRTGLLGGLCLQLAELAVMNPKRFKLCANATCGRRFLRQRGRAKERQLHTKGVIYCSTQCASQQSSRAWRAAKKKERSE